MDVFGDRTPPLVIPVIHHRDFETSVAQAVLARDLGADGVFLISHGMADAELPSVLLAAKAAAPGLPIGLNLLSTPLARTFELALSCGADMVWADHMGVTSEGLDQTGELARDFAATGRAPLLFASVAFKHQKHESRPAVAAANALAAGLIPTTSGPRTGTPPTVSKIAPMSAATGGVLAIASGMDPDNVHMFSPFVSHILVATGISLDGDLIDPAKLSLFIEKSRRIVRR